jgi:hypothetical protein
MYDFEAFTKKVMVSYKRLWMNVQIEYGCRIKSEYS